MPVQFDPSWEYYVPDFEVEEALDFSPQLDLYDPGLHFGKLYQPRDRQSSYQRVCKNPNCAIRFQPKPNKPNQRYCSIPCAARCARRSKTTSQRKKVRYRPQVELGIGCCPVCGKKIPPSKARNPNNVKRFCSPRCKKINSTRNRYQRLKLEANPMDIPQWLSEGHRLRNAAIRLAALREKVTSNGHGNGHHHGHLNGDDPLLSAKEDYRMKLLKLRQMVEDELERLASPPALATARQVEHNLSAQLVEILEPIEPETPEEEVDPWQYLADQYGEAILVLPSAHHSGAGGTSAVPESMASASDKAQALRRVTPR